MVTPTQPRARIRVRTHSPTNARAHGERHSVPDALALENGGERGDEKEDKRESKARNTRNPETPKKRKARKKKNRPETRLRSPGVAAFIVIVRED